MVLTTRGVGRGIEGRFWEVEFTTQGCLLNIGIEGINLVKLNEILRCVFDGFGRFVEGSLRRGKWLGDRSLFGMLQLEKKLRRLTRECRLNEGWRIVSCSVHVHCSHHGDWHCKGWWIGKQIKIHSNAITFQFGPQTSASCDFAQVFQKTTTCSISLREIEVHYFWILITKFYYFVIVSSRLASSPYRTVWWSGHDGREIWETRFPSLDLRVCRHCVCISTSISIYILSYNSYLQVVEKSE